MKGRGLDKEIIIKEAVRLIFEVGEDGFSLRELSKRLDVKPASLYNHVDGIGEIEYGVFLHVAGELSDVLEKATNGKNPDDAFLDGAMAYRHYAISKPQFYRVLINLPKSDREKYREAAFASFAPMRKVIKSYGLDKLDNMTFSIALRSFMHGNIELSTGRLSAKGEMTSDEMYMRIIKSYLEVLKAKATEKQCRN